MTFCWKINRVFENFLEYDLLLHFEIILLVYMARHCRSVDLSKMRYMVENFYKSSVVPVMVAGGRGKKYTFIFC